MGRKRKKSDYPDDWDIVEESQDPDAWDLFETVEETQDPDANENEVKQVTTTLSQLQPPSQVLEPDPVYRLKQYTKDVHSSVICKLTRILRVPELLPEIKRISVVMKQVQLEGWHLANLHVLRCLEEGDELQDLDQMFFYRCCAVTLTKHPSVESKFPSFHKSCLRYWERRADIRSYASEEVMHGGAMINETAKLMSINALNMLALHFRRRLHQYVRFRYAPENKTELSYRETKRLVDSCYCVKDVHRTSITCSCCHQRLKQARLFTKMKRKEDEEDIREKENLSRKEIKEVAEMRKFRNRKLANKKIVLQCTRNVLRCVNSRCRANFWNRDVNAARNMVELLRSGLKGKRGTKRLRAFRRGQ